MARSFTCAPNSTVFEREAKQMQKQLTISYEKYTPLQREARGDYTPLPPRFSIYVEDEVRNLFVFQSDGLTVTAHDLRFVHMRGESRNSYTYREGKHTTRIMARPVKLYGEGSNAPSKTASDVKLIRAVIRAVTARPVQFPADDCNGLSLSKVIMTYQ